MTISPCSRHQPTDQPAHEPPQESQKQVTTGAGRVQKGVFCLSIRSGSEDQFAICDFSPSGATIAKTPGPMIRIGCHLGP